MQLKRCQLNELCLIRRASPQDQFSFENCPAMLCGFGTFMLLGLGLFVAACVLPVVLAFVFVVLVLLVLFIGVVMTAPFFDSWPGCCQLDRAVLLCLPILGSDVAMPVNLLSVVWEAHLWTERGVQGQASIF